MKKLLVTSVIALAFLASCGGNDGKSKSDSTNDTTTNAAANPGDGNKTAMKYQCPMKCEGEKTYDAPGKCPQCQMDLKEVK